MKYKLFTKHDVDSKKVLLKPGDFFLMHGNDFFDKLIQVSTMSRWNHAGLIIDKKGTIIEVTTEGIRKKHISEYPKKDVYIVSIDMSVDDRAEVIAYAEYMVKKHIIYGFLTIITIIFKILTKSRLVVKLDGTLICSEFVARALSQGGIIWDKDPSLFTPADLYNKFIKKMRKSH